MCWDFGWRVWYGSSGAYVLLAAACACAAACTGGGLGGALCCLSWGCAAFLCTGGYVLLAAACFAAWYGTGCAPGLFAFFACTLLVAAYVDCGCACWTGAWRCACCT